jgi:single-strand DNA-binding protein
MGNLCRDPELRVTPKGTPICQFSLAINRTWTGQDGQKNEEVVYVDVEAWGKQGETIAKYCTKGRPLYVEGRLKLEQWDDKKSGEKRSRMKVVLEQFQFLGSGRDSDAGSGDGGTAPRAQQQEFGSGPAAAPRSTAAPPARPSRSAPQPATQENLDEDVPF